MVTTRKRAAEARSAIQSTTNVKRPVTDVVSRTSRGPVGPKYKMLKGAYVPLEILVLPHILHTIDEFAMIPEEVTLKAFVGDDLELLQTLKDRFNLDESDILEFAAANEESQAVRMLLPEVIGEGEFTLSDEVSDSLTKMAVTAAGNGHYEVVELLLGEIQEEREDEDEGEFVYYGYEQDIENKKNEAAWEILDEAAANGHAEIVELAASCIDTTDHELEPAVENSMALENAISGGHVKVVESLLDFDNHHWNLVAAFKQAIDCEELEIAELIYGVYSPHFEDDSLIVRMASSGDLDAVKYLCDLDDQDVELVDRAFVKASKHHDVVKFLGESGRVSSRLLNKLE